MEESWEQTRRISPTYTLVLNILTVRASNVKQIVYSQFKLPMLYGLTHTLDQLGADLPRVLWPQSARDRVEALVRRFPEVPAQRNIGPVRLGVVGLELRLGTDADQVDLTFPLLKDDRDALLALAAEADGSWLCEDRWWRRLLALGRAWADGESLLGRVVQRLWLEIDIAPSAVEMAGDEMAGTLPAPGIFVGFEPATTHGLDLARWRQVFVEIVETLGGQPPESALVARFEDLLSAVVADARAPGPSPVIQYLGLMLSRGAGAVRCVVAAPPGQRFVPWRVGALAPRLGWPGDGAGLGETLDELTTSAEGESVHDGVSALQLDLTARETLPRLGLELVLDRTIQRATGRVGEVDLLDRLVDAGLCGAEKARALLDLPVRNFGPWGATGRVGHALEAHHVKLVVDGEARTGRVEMREAKAYCGQSLVVERCHGVSDSARSAEDAEIMSMTKGEVGS